MFLMDFIKIFIVVQIGRLAVLILFQRRFYKREKNANCELIDYSSLAHQYRGVGLYSVLCTVLCTLYSVLYIVSQLISASCNAMLLHPPEDWLM